MSNRVTQGSTIVLYRQNKPPRVTQGATIVLYDPKRTILPSETTAPSQIQMRPDNPVTENWEYLSTEFVSGSGWEQRMSLREHPRYRFSFNCFLGDEHERRSAFYYIMRYYRGDFLFPIYPYSIHLDQAAAQGATRIYFPPVWTDIRAGDDIAFYNEYTDTVTFGKVTTLETDGANVEALSEAMGVHCAVMPAMRFRLPTGAAIRMGPLAGDAQLDLVSVSRRPVRRPGVANVMTYITDIGVTYPLLNQRPLANQNVEEGFEQGLRVIDNNVAPAAIYTEWEFAKSGGTRQFQADRGDGLDYWREFAQATQGRRGAFLAPTWRADLFLAANPALGATFLDVTPLDYHEVFRQLTYRRLWIETENGFIWRRVTSAQILYDGAEESAVRIRLNAPLGGSVGDNVIKKISFLNICRLTDDNIRLEHDGMQTQITVAWKTVNE